MMKITTRTHTQPCNGPSGISIEGWGIKSLFVFALNWGRDGMEYLDSLFTLLSPLMSHGLRDCLCHLMKQILRARFAIWLIRSWSQVYPAGVRCTWSWLKKALWYDIMQKPTWGRDGMEQLDCNQDVSFLPRVLLWVTASWTVCMTPWNKSWEVRYAVWMI